MIRVQSSVISDHFKSRVLDEQATGQQVNESLETEDDMMTELNGGALTDFFHSYSVLEEEVKADVSKEPEVNENSDLIHVQDFLNLTDHDLAGPRSISPKFKVNSGNPEVRDDVKMSVEGSDLYHEHPHVDFVSDVLQSKMNGAKEAASNVAAPSPPDSKLVKESSQPAEYSLTLESSDLITPLVVLSPSSPSSTPASSTTLDSSSTSDAAPPPAFSPAEYVPSPEVQLSSEPSTLEPSTTEPSTSEPSKKENSSTEHSSLSISPEPVTQKSVSTAPAMDDSVDDGADSLDNLFLELENLNILNDAVKALNKGPQVAEDRTDVIDDGYDADETNNIFTDLFQWFG